jgi:hypothetical protein
MWHRNPPGPARGRRAPIRASPPPGLILRQAQDEAF